MSNIYYLNARILESYVGSLTRRLSLAVTTGPIPLCCVQLQLAPPPAVDFFVPDEVQEVIGSYERNRFIRVAVTGPEGYLLGLGHFTEPKWFDIMKFKGIELDVKFPHKAPADWNGQHAGWVNMCITKASLKCDDHVMRLELLLSAPDRKERVEICYTDGNVALMGEHIRSILQITSTKSWPPEGRYVRVRKDEKGALWIGHLFQDTWFNTSSF